MIGPLRLPMIATILLVTTAGCATAPPPVRPDLEFDLPEDWSAGTATAATAGPPPIDWWIGFADADLDRLIDEALAGNLDLRVAAARVEAAAAAARIAGADQFPDIGVGLDGARQHQVFVGFPIPGGVLSTTSTRYGVGLQTTWEVDLWGRARAGAAAGMADYQATVADYHGSRLSLAGQTAKAWFAVTEARLQLELAEATVSSFRSTVERVRSRFESGLRPSLDLRLALSDLATGEALLELRANQRQRAARQLEILLGRYPAAELAGAADLAPVPGAVPALLPADIVSRRPDLAAAERRLAAADRRVVQAKRSLYPRLLLTGTAGTVSDDLGQLLDGDFGVWSLIGNLFQPVFQGGRLRAGVDRARAGSDAELAGFADAVLTALGEVETILAAESFLARQQGHLEQAAVQAEAALVLARDRYDAGLIDLIIVLESQRRSLNRQAELLAVRRQRLEARIDLHLALGGGFEYDSSLPPADVGATSGNEAVAATADPEAYR